MYSNPAEEPSGSIQAYFECLQSQVGEFGLWADGGNFKAELSDNRDVEITHGDKDERRECLQAKKVVHITCLPRSIYLAAAPCSLPSGSCFEL